MPPEAGKSPLTPAKMSRGTCVVDVLFVRFPLGDAESNGSLWSEIDEQHFPDDVRRQLAYYGFRVGWVGGQMPLALARMLELNDETPPTGQANQVDLDVLESAPRVVRRHIQLPPGQRREILTSGIYDELPVLVRESDRLGGRSYAKAQGALGIAAHPQPDGRVRLDLVPELHYGEAGQRFVGDQGVFRLDTRRPRRDFGDLAFSATLAAGDMLIVSCLPNRPGSLGHYFFTHECDGKAEQKLLVIRVSQTQHDRLFEQREWLAFHSPQRDP